MSDPIKMDREFTSWTAILQMWTESGTESVPVTLLDTPQRRKMLRAREIAVGEVIVAGSMLKDDEVVNESHVFWVRTTTNEIVGCFKTQCGVMKELSLHMCSKIWGNVPTRDMEPNERVLSTGTRIPKVPPRFYVYKLNHAETARRSRHRMPPCKRRKVDSEAVDLEATAGNQTHHSPFDRASAPTLLDARVSVRPAVAQSFFRATRKPTSTKQTAPRRQPTTQVPVFRNHVWDVLDSARKQVCSHPSYASLFHTDPFADVRVIDDLPNITTRFHGMDVPISKELLRWFHYFFPHSDASS